MVILSLKPSPFMGWKKLILIIAYIAAKAVQEIRYFKKFTKIFFDFFYSSLEVLLLWLAKGNWAGVQLQPLLKEPSKTSFSNNCCRSEQIFLDWIFVLPGTFKRAAAEHQLSSSLAAEEATSPEKSSSLVSLKHS